MKFLTIAKWEFLEKVRSKAFIVSLVLFPVIMVTFGVLPGILATKSDDRTISVGVLDESNAVMKPLGRKLDERYRLPDGEPNYTVRDLAEFAVSRTY